MTRQCYPSRDVLNGVVVKLDCGIDGGKETKTCQCYPNRNVWMASWSSLVVVLIEASIQRRVDALRRDVGM